MKDYVQKYIILYKIKLKPHYLNVSTLYNIFDILYVFIIKKIFNLDIFYAIILLKIIQAAA